MRKYLISFGLLFVSLALGSDDGISPERTRRDFRNSKISQGYKTPMHKALFTQRGYIQFLRWELPVPEIEEFTFCMWIKSANLTYSHSIFSYSKDEKERLVSSWISPFGRSIHLEIGGAQIMSHPTNIKEHRWYHICQSWDNQIGHYGLWIDGRIETEGFTSELIGHVIPSSGDIVVGQEYTDFDKGFEEGIEGAVFGFNLVLSSAFEKSDDYYPESNRVSRVLSSTHHHPLPNLRRSDEVIPDFQKIVNEKREGMFDSTLREYLGEDQPFDAGLRRSDGREILAVKFVHRINKRDVSGGRIKRRGDTPLGLDLVNLSYNHCQIGRGSPFIGGSKMLISWTRTPVKVFGGAIIKNAEGTCGNF